MVGRFLRTAIDKKLLWPGRYRKGSYGISSHPRVKFPHLRGEHVDEVKITVGEKWEVTYSDGRSEVLSASEHVVEEGLRDGDAIVAFGWHDGQEEWQDAILIKYPLLVNPDPDIPVLVLTEEHQAFESPVCDQIRTHAVPWASPRSAKAVPDGGSHTKKHSKSRRVKYFSTIFDDRFPEPALRRKGPRGSVRRAAATVEEIRRFVLAQGAASRVAKVKQWERPRVSLSLIHAEGEIVQQVPARPRVEPRPVTTSAQIEDTTDTIAEKDAQDTLHKPFWTTYFVPMSSLTERRKKKSSTTAPRDPHHSLRGKYLT